MFVELMPLLAGRTVLTTVAKVDDKTILPTRGVVVCRLESHPLAVGAAPTLPWVISIVVVQHRRIPACLKLKANLRVFVDSSGWPSAFCF